MRRGGVGAGEASPSAATMAVVSPRHRAAPGVSSSLVACFPGSIRLRVDSAEWIIYCALIRIVQRQRALTTNDDTEVVRDRVDNAERERTAYHSRFFREPADRVERDHRGDLHPDAPRGLGPIVAAGVVAPRETRGAEIEEHDVDRATVD